MGKIPLKKNHGENIFMDRRLIEKLMIKIRLKYIFDSYKFIFFNFGSYNFFIYF